MKVNPKIGKIQLKKVVLNEQKAFQPSEEGIRKMDLRIESEGNKLTKKGKDKLKEILDAEEEEDVNSEA